MKVAVVSLFIMLYALSANFSEVGGEKRHEKKCTEPKASDGDFYMEGCLRITCKNGVWRPSLEETVCCYQRQAYTPHTIITATTAQDGCTTSSIECRLDGGNAKMIVQLENSCPTPASQDQFEGLEDMLKEQISEIDQLDGSCQTESTSSTASTTTATTTTSTTTTTTEENLLVTLENKGMVFMEMDSFQKALIIIKLGGQFYNIDDSFITMNNKTIPLTILSPQDVIWKNNDSFEFKQRAFSKVMISKEAPNSSYPEPGIYVKSRSSGNELAMVFYSDTYLVGMKLTGSAHVPSSKTSFKFNMETHKLLVQYANKGFVSPEWNENHEMVKITKYTFEWDYPKKDNLGSVYNHISRFVPYVIE